MGNQALVLRLDRYQLTLNLESQNRFRAKHEANLKNIVEMLKAFLQTVEISPETIEEIINWYSNKESGLKAMEVATLLVTEPSRISDHVFLEYNVQREDSYYLGDMIIDTYNAFLNSFSEKVHLDKFQLSEEKKDLLCRFFLIILSEYTDLFNPNVLAASMNQVLNGMGDIFLANYQIIHR